MAKTRKPKKSAEAPASEAAESLSPILPEPGVAESAVAVSELLQAPFAEIAQVIDAQPLDSSTSSASADAALESPPLENAGEMEDESAVVVDPELSALLTSPIGLRGALEALLFVSPEPLTTRRIGNVLDLRDSRLILATLKQLQSEYDNERRGIRIVESAEGFQMATRELYGDLILRLKGRRRRPALSPTALETLAIVAYRQPVIRAEVEAIRGVESSGAIRNLIDMGLVEMVGRKDVLGRPPMYGTTAQFLSAFALKDLSELPSIAELKRQSAESAQAAEAEEQSALAVKREEEMHQRLETSESIRRQAEEAAAAGIGIAQSDEQKPIAEDETMTLDEIEEDPKKKSKPDDDDEEEDEESEDEDDDLDDEDEDDDDDDEDEDEDDDEDEDEDEDEDDE